MSSRVALVTGASGGLGSQMVGALLKAGYRVVLSGTGEQALRAVAGAEPASRWRLVTADLSEPEAAARLAREATAVFGRVDILINNAGISTSAIDSGAPDKPVRFWSITAAMTSRFYQINTLSPLRLTALLAPAMIERGWGRIVNVTTSLRTMLLYAGYGGSKAALEAETACMAADLANSGVTANALLPGGPTATRMTANFPIPAADMLQADIVVAPILYLASSGSDGVTGRRFIAALWDPALPPDQAAGIASAAIAWSSLATMPVRPRSRS